MSWAVTDQPPSSDGGFQSVFQACHSTDATVNPNYFLSGCTCYLKLIKGVNWYTCNHDVNGFGANEISFICTAFVGTLFVFN